MYPDDNLVSDLVPAKWNTVKEQKFKKNIQKHYSAGTFNIMSLKKTCAA